MRYPAVILALAGVVLLGALAYTLFLPDTQTVPPLMDEETPPVALHGETPYVPARQDLPPLPVPGAGAIRGIVVAREGSAPPSIDTLTLRLFPTIWEEEEESPFQAETIVEVIQR